MKINFENAAERIAQITSVFPRDGEGYFLTTEEQFEKTVESILNESTKAFAEALKKQTHKHTVSRYDARISTYKKDFGFFRFV